MNEIEWFQNFVQKYEDKIIDSWLNEVEPLIPSNVYDQARIQTNSRIYFRLLVDILIPLEEHPLFDIVPSICKFHAEQNTSIELMLHGSHLWRKVLFDHIWSYIEEQDIRIDRLNFVIPTVHKRIDSAQRIISQIYWEHANKIIAQKQKTINDLHNDRLNMLGKMAASMAHELRNPLFALEGFLKLTRSELSEESLKRVGYYLDVMENEFAGLYRQITSFLSFSKNNGLEEPYVTCSIHDLIYSIVDLLQPRCNNDNVELVLLIDHEIELTVQKTALQQVLLNIINNAIDALETISSPKKVEINAFEDEHSYYITVKDNGIGIPAEIKETIFTPFVTTKKNGTGLGLSVCKQIMQKNEGDITFTSSPSETIFTISLVKNCSISQLVK